MDIVVKNERESVWVLIKIERWMCVFVCALTSIISRWHVFDEIIFFPLRCRSHTRAVFVHSEAALDEGDTTIRSEGACCGFVWFLRCWPRKDYYYYYYFEWYCVHVLKGDKRPWLKEERKEFKKRKGSKEFGTNTQKNSTNEAFLKMKHNVEQESDWGQFDRTDVPARLTCDQHDGAVSRPSFKLFHDKLPNLQPPICHAFCLTLKISRPSAPNLFFTSS